MFERTQQIKNSDQVVEKPSWSRIESYVTPDEMGFILPPTGFRGITLFFLIFTVIWNGSVWTAFWAALKSGDMGGVFFLMPFIAVGVITLCVFLYLLKVEVAILINRQEVSISRTIFGKSYSKICAYADLEQVLLIESYRQNSVPVFAVGLVFKGGKKIKFGSNLKEDEKQWMLSEVLRFREA